PRDVLELMSYFQPAAPDQRVRAVPGSGLDVPVCILGSSLYGAQLAAALGLPYALASHFAPVDLDQAIRLYRLRFDPLGDLKAPYVMAGFNVFAADTDAAAELLLSSHQQAFVNLRTGSPGPLPAPKPGFFASLDPRLQAMLRQSLSCTAVGAPETVRKGLEDFIARTGVDEIMVTGQICDHEAR